MAYFTLIGMNSQSIKVNTQNISTLDLAWHDLVIVFLISLSTCNGIYIFGIRKEDELSSRSTLVNLINEWNHSSIFFCWFLAFALSLKYWFGNSDISEGRETFESKMGNLSTSTRKMFGDRCSSATKDRRSSATTSSATNNRNSIGDLVESRTR